MSPLQRKNATRAQFLTGSCLRGGLQQSWGPGLSLVHEQDEVGGTREDVTITLTTVTLRQPSPAPVD